MNATLLILAGIILLVVIATIAWLLYRANFRPKEITVKTGILEAKMERENETPPKPEVIKRRTEASQTVSDGAQIIDSNIKAPAQSGAKLKQDAKGKGSEISGSDIELK